MLGRVSFYVCLAFGASLLGACAIGPSAQSAAAVPAAAGRETGPLRGLQPCMGSGGVEVTPCPAELRSKKGVLVTVSGPGASYAQWGTCQRLCQVKYVSPLQSHIHPWHDTCAKGSLTYSAFTASGELIGYFNLKVVDRYCP
jgi:hypothetical protein